MFANQLRESANESTTENGAKTHISSRSAVLDLFGNGGALRTRQESEIENLVGMAAKEDLQSTLRTVLYLRDVRGGQGERRTFRIALRYLAMNYPGAVRKNLKLIPTYGRFDDVWTALLGTSLELDVVEFIDLQLTEDQKSERPSLLAKWLPSENATSKETRSNARKIASLLLLKPRKYRKLLSSLRAKIDVVERKMSAREWTAINYSGVPSRAMLNYRKAFKKNDEVRYERFLESVEAGEIKIKATTLFPYDIVHKINHGDQDKTLELQWAALPNYIEEEANALVLCDLSGSMAMNYGQKVTPMDVSISLSLYIAERNKGAFHNIFIPFSQRARAVEVRGATLTDKLRAIASSSNWCGSTNLQAAFDEILRVAVQSKARADEMPRTLFIISDMEFDAACSKNDKSNFEEAKRKFSEAGYELPEIVFWNVCSRNNQVPVTKDERGAYLVSGCSPSILKNALNKKAKTPFEMMMEVINSDRYKEIQV